jgi:hypothetical protein
MGIGTTKYGRRKDGLKNLCKRLPLNVFMFYRMYVSIKSIHCGYELGPTVTNCDTSHADAFSF